MDMAICLQLPKGLCGVVNTPSITCTVSAENNGCVKTIEPSEGSWQLSWLYECLPSTQNVHGMGNPMDRAGFPN